MRSSGSGLDQDAEAQMRRGMAEEEAGRARRPSAGDLLSLPPRFGSYNTDDEMPPPVAIAWDDAPVGPGLEVENLTPDETTWIPAWDYAGYSESNGLAAAPIDRHPLDTAVINGVLGGLSWINEKTQIPPLVKAVNNLQSRVDVAGQRALHNGNMAAFHGYGMATGIIAAVAPTGVLDVIPGGKSTKLARVAPELGDAAGINRGLSPDTEYLAKFGENAANRTYRDLDLTINERGLLAQERELAQASGWKRIDGSTWYPPYDGAIPGTQRVVSLEPGSGGSLNLIDRFGRTSGTYVSPEGMSLESRALSYTPSSSPSIYSVNTTITGVERSTIAPWFDQKGLGVQYKLQDSVQYYLDTRALGEWP